MGAPTVRARRDSILAPALLNELHKIKVVPTVPSVSEPKIAPAKVPTLSVFSRMVPGEPDPDLRLVTLAVVNEVPGTGPGSAFFQMGFTATAAGRSPIEPYPDVEQPDSDEEEESIALLYRTSAPSRSVTVAPQPGRNRRSP